MTTMTPMPADSYSLSCFPLSDVIAYFIYNPCNLMTRNPWILDAWEYSFFSKGITMAYAACLYLYSNLSSTRFWNISFNNFKRTISFRNLN